MVACFAVLSFSLNALPSFDPGLIAAFIPVGIILGSIAIIVKTVARRRKRMARIAARIRPDSHVSAQRVRTRP